MISNKYILYINKMITFLLFTAISIIAFLPNYNGLPPVVTISSVLNHMIGFFVLAGFLHVSFEFKIQTKILVLLMYGFFIESVQYFLPNRFFDFFDIVVNMFGVGLFYLLIFWFKKYTMQNNENELQ